MVPGKANPSSAEADIRSGFKRHRLLGPVCSKVDCGNVGLGVPWRLPRDAHVVVQPNETSGDAHRCDADEIARVDKISRPPPGQPTGDSSLTVESYICFSFSRLALMSRALRQRPRKKLRKSYTAFSDKVQVVVCQGQVVRAPEFRRRFRRGE